MQQMFQLGMIALLLTASAKNDKFWEVSSNTFFLLQLW